MTSPRPPVPSRRSWLGGVLAGTVGLPWLESLSAPRAYAQTVREPCFVVMFSPNGTVQNQWTPGGTERDFTLPAILGPLEPQRSDLIIVSGLTQQGAKGDGHQNGMSGMLTGAPLLSGRFSGQGVPPTGWASGPSVDQRIADFIGGETPFRSLELGVQVGAADNLGRMCYRASNRPLPPRDDPRQVFEQVFAAGLRDPALAERRRQRRASVLDFVQAELAALESEVSAADRQILQSHFSELRSVEQRLERQLAEANACPATAPPASLPAGNDAFPAIGALQVDLLVLALACGRTRVASLQWSRAVSQVRFNWLSLPSPETHHDLSHRPDDDAAAQQSLTLINRWYAEQFASLLTKLRARATGDGTLLDRCLLLWCNELGTGNVHSRKNAPYVLAGSAHGALRTGRHLRYTGDGPHNDLLVSILNAFGIEDTSFGLAEWCRGPLSGFA